MTNKNLLLHIDQQNIATLTLNRPELHNAFDEELIRDFNTTLIELEDNSHIRVLILNAAGKNFSAGADLNWMQRQANAGLEQNREDAINLALLMRNLNNFSKPTLALVQGAAYGGGVGLIACCDIVIATSQAKFCLSEVKLGLIPAVISPYVIDAIGARAARRYFQTAEIFTAAEALRLGLVHQLVEPAETQSVTQKIIQALLDNGPQAMVASKQLIAYVANRLGDEDLLRYTAETIAMIRASKEGQEGVTAFLEKRKAQW
jgi:methylglutaconyl-CoA hydratase